VPVLRHLPHGAAWRSPLERGVHSHRGVRRELRHDVSVPARTARARRPRHPPPPMCGCPPNRPACGDVRTRTRTDSQRA
jgi:hypothetical protein